MTVQKKKSKNYLNFNRILVVFSLFPMMISVIITMVLLINTSSDVLKDNTQNSMLSLVKETGAGFESYISNGEATLRNFAKSPVVINFLKNQKDKKLQKEAQEYTMDFFDASGNMEAIYISDWSSTTLTHPVESAIGKPTRRVTN